MPELLAKKRVNRFPLNGGTEKPQTTIDTQTETNQLLEISINTITKELPNDNRPYARVQIFHTTLLGLLDSGASVSILGSEALNKLASWPEIQQKKVSQKIRTADGTTHAIETKINVPIAFNGRKRNIELLIAPRISQSLILGTNFWEAFEIEVKLPTVMSILPEEIKPGKPKSPKILHELTNEQMKALAKIKSEFKFSEKGSLTFTTQITHKIDTGSVKPIKQRPYQFSPFLQNLMNNEVDRMLQLGIIEKISSPTWLSPVTIVQKANGGVRLCLDARKLNEHTIKNSYPQQNANRILRQIKGIKYLSSLDLSDAYYQIKIAPESRNHTAFAVSGKGTYRYKRMANGLCNASSTLCELIDNVLGCDLEPHVFPYMDDFIVCTDSFEKHLEILSEVAKRLKNANLAISAEKSHFLLRQISYLGYIISDEGIFPDNEKIKPILEYPTPNNIKAVRRFIGMTGYYRRFIPDFSTIAAPITERLKTKYLKFEWTAEANAAFESLKSLLIEPPILTPPNYDKPFEVHCDASNVGIGAVLIQRIQNKEHNIAFYSAKLEKAEINYSTTEKECLAVIRALENFAPYLAGYKFTVITDHASLKWLQTIKDPSGRLARWAMRLQALNFELVHQKGKLNVVPDALSRAPIDTGSTKPSSRGEVPAQWTNAIDIQNLTNTTDKTYIENFQKCRDNIDNHKYQIRKGILEINVSKTGPADWKIAIPVDHVKQTLHEIHSDILAGHGGYWKTLKRAKQDYYWNTMRIDIKRYIQSCEICKGAKSSNQNAKTPMGKFRNYTKPWKKVAIDYIGPMPRSKGGSKWLLTMVDCFSKFVIIKPLREATAKLTTDSIENEIFLKYGVPESIISDNGAQFKSKVFQTMLEKYRVKLETTSNYHPQANPCEATNKTIGTLLKCYTDKNEHRNWDKIIPAIQCSMNTSHHHTTQKTPYEINFGTKMITMGDRHRDTPNESQNDIENKIEKIRKEVQAELLRNYETAKRKYDKKTKPNEYQIGDTVWKKNTTLSNKVKGITYKLQPRYDQCKIVGKIGTNTYILADEKGKMLGKFSSESLKRDS